MEGKKTRWFLASKQDGFTEIIESREYPKTVSQGGLYTVIRSFDTREQLDKTILPDKCKECFGVIYIDYVGNVGEQLREKQVCHSCNHWIEIIEDINNPRRVIVNGCSYYRKDYREIAEHLQHCLGFSGQIFNIKMKSGEIYRTNDLWYNGEIPKRFLSRLLDNAIFLKS